MSVKTLKTNEHEGDVDVLLGTCYHPGRDDEVRRRRKSPDFSKKVQAWLVPRSEDVDEPRKGKIASSLVYLRQGARKTTQNEHGMELGLGRSFGRTSLVKE